MRKEWGLETSDGDSWADKGFGATVSKLIPTVLRIYPHHLPVPPGKSDIASPSEEYAACSGK